MFFGVLLKQIQGTSKFPQTLTLWEQAGLTCLHLCEQTFSKCMVWFSLVKTKLKGLAFTKGLFRDPFLMLF